MYIYKITNKINGNFYIGKTVYKNPYKRWLTHQSGLKHCQKYNKKLTHLQNALVKYGIDVFSFDVIEKTNKENLSEREIYWITELNPHYNMTIGGEGVCGIKPYIRTKDIKEKISSSKRNKKWIYNIETLEEKQIYLIEFSEFNEKWKFGRSPQTKHGGKRGEYTKERAEKFTKWVKENTNGMLGKKHSEKTKQKIGSKNKTKLKNMIFWNNGIENKRFREQPDNTWKKGRIPFEKIECEHCGKMYDPGNFKKHQIMLKKTNPFQS